MIMKRQRDDKGRTLEEFLAAYRPGDYPRPSLTADAIVSNIVKALKPGGRAVISICNPFFNNVAHTELKSEGVCKKYDTSEKFVKTLSNGGRQRDEYHRPIEFYRNLFSRNGLVITCFAASFAFSLP